MKSIKNILAGLSYKFDGDFQKIFDAICSKQSIEDAEVDEALSNITTPFITILDADYPECFRNGVPKPPIVIYYKGDLSLLTNRDKYHYVGIVGSPVGVKAIQEAHPDVNIFLAALDEKLNEHGYIVPGLGDAGDRIFGTK